MEVWAERKVNSKDIKCHCSNLGNKKLKFFSSYKNCEHSRGLSYSTTTALVKNF